ncbi:MAG: MOSC domain-containing protein [Crocinitomicaceae bacterium]
MRVVSVNLGERKTVSWRGKEVETGIFKYPVDSAIVLGKEDVEKDHVIDRKYHGGINKACYIYSADHYNYWKDLYPELDWTYGMFGENITIQGLNESKIYLGDIYQIGQAKVEVVQPREPCFKLGIRFGTQKVVKQFLNAPYPGVYLRIIEEGEVQANDSVTLIQQGNTCATFEEVYRLSFHSKPEDNPKIEAILQIEQLPAGLRSNLEKRLKLNS